MIAAFCAWVCEACGHHNPLWRTACRECRTDRRFGTFRGAS